MRTITLLGPQRLKPSLVTEVNRLGIDGQVAAITAGWQEREAENEELQAHLERPVVDLRLHARAEQVFAEDRELSAAHRARQDRLRELQALYRFRLDFALKPARELMRRAGNPRLLEPEREAAITAIRTLDREHLGRIREVHAEFAAQILPWTRPAVVRHLEEITQILAHSKALAIAGGHVAVLLNRLRLFNLGELSAHLPLFCWSAGAMACSERVVLFHDFPPQGGGNTEVLEVGLGLFPNLVPLPHARRRLRLDDPVRVALFARRFAPNHCVAFDDGSALRFDGSAWNGTPKTRLLAADGIKRPVKHLDSLGSEER